MRTPKLELLSTAMRTYQQRLGATASNLANLETPGYKRLSVSFEDELQRARQGSGGPERLGRIEPRLEVGDTAPVLEDEMMELADTQMRTQLSARALHDHFAVLRQAIIGRAG